MTVQHFYKSENGDRIEEPQPPADPYACPLDEMETYLLRKQYYDEFVRRDTSNRQRAAVDPAYEMPLEDLRARCNLNAEEAEAAERDARAATNAHTFLTIEPRFKKTAANAQKMKDFLDKHHMLGTVADLQYSFEELAGRGELELKHMPPAPKKVFSAAELRAMPLAEMKDALEQMRRDGIF